MTIYSAPTLKLTTSATVLKGNSTAEFILFLIRYQIFYRNKLETMEKKRKVILLLVLVFVIVATILFCIYYDPEVFGTNNENKSVNLSVNNKLKQPPFPIDLVYTWAGESGDKNDPRMRDNQELKYSLRSVHENLPWVNRIFILMNPPSAVPSWMKDEDLERITILDHNDIVLDSCGPIVKGTKNSPAIESALACIPELSEHFIYLNDDFMINRPIPYTNFFSTDGNKIKVPRGTMKIIKNNKLSWPHVPIPLTKSIINSYNKKNRKFIKQLRSEKYRRGGYGDQMQKKWTKEAIDQNKVEYSDNFKVNRLPCEPGYMESWCILGTPKRKNLSDYFIINDSGRFKGTPEKITKTLDKLFPSPSPYEKTVT